MTTGWRSAIALAVTAALLTMAPASADVAAPKPPPISKLARAFNYADRILTVIEAASFIATLAVGADARDAAEERAEERAEEWRAEFASIRRSFAALDDSLEAMEDRLLAAIEGDQERDFVRDIAGIFNQLDRPVELALSPGFRGFSRSAANAYDEGRNLLIRKIGEAAAIEAKFEHGTLFAAEHARLATYLMLLHEVDRRLGEADPGLYLQQSALLREIGARLVAEGRPLPREIAAARRELDRRNARFNAAPEIRLTETDAEFRIVACTMAEPEVTLVRGDGLRCPATRDERLHASSCSFGVSYMVPFGARNHMPEFPDNASCPEIAEWLEMVRPGRYGDDPENCLRFGTVYDVAWEQTRLDVTFARREVGLVQDFYFAEPFVAAETHRMESEDPPFDPEEAVRRDRDGVKCTAGFDPADWTRRYLDYVADARGRWLALENTRAAILAANAALLAFEETIAD